MANIKSAKTRVRRNAKRTRINSDRLNAVRTAVKKTRAAIATGDKEVATNCFKAAESALMSAAGKKTLHKKATESELLACSLPSLR